MAASSHRSYWNHVRATLAEDRTERDLLDQTSCRLDSEMAPIDPKTLKIASVAGEDFSFWEFIRGRGDGEEVALAYAHVFWPELVEIEGFILVKENYDPEYLSRVVAECSRENVEATINTTYLHDLFKTDVPGTDQSVWTALGELIRDAWRGRAQTQFPHTEFTATFAWYSEDGDPGVTLFQTKLPPSKPKPTRGA